jgi:hypothetical protein
VIEKSWKNSFDKDGPSCPLYRKRVANYYQRLSEYETANKLLAGKLSPKELFHLLDLWKRMNSPLNTADTAILHLKYVLDNPDLKFFNLENSVEIKSEHLNWKSDKLLFPDSFIRYSLNKSINTLDLSIELPYAEACLTNFPLIVQVTNKDGSKLLLEIEMNKFDWDLNNN